MFGVVPMWRTVTHKIGPLSDFSVYQESRFAWKTWFYGYPKVKAPKSNQRPCPNCLHWAHTAEIAKQNSVIGWQVGDVTQHTDIGTFWAFWHYNSKCHTQCQEAMYYLYAHKSLFLDCLFILKAYESQIARWLHNNAEQPNRSIFIWQNSWLRIISACICWTVEGDSHTQPQQTQPHKYFWKRKW